MRLFTVVPPPPHPIQPEQLNLMDNLFDCIHSRLQVKFLGFEAVENWLVTPAPRQNLILVEKKFAPYK